MPNEITKEEYKSDVSGLSKDYQRDRAIISALRELIESDKQKNSP